MSCIAEFAYIPTIRRSVGGLGPGIEDERGQENVHSIGAGGQLYK